MRCIIEGASVIICDIPACMLVMKSGKSIMRNCREFRQKPTNMAGPGFDAVPLSARRVKLCMTESS